MDLSTLQMLIGDLTNDPVHDRYSLAQINTELDNSQNRWNVEAKIIKRIVPETLIDGTRSYAIAAGIGRTVIAFGRVTHAGLALKKRDKAWFDLYSGHDWSTDSGTPTSYYINFSSSVVSEIDDTFIVVHPTPTAADVAAGLLVTETICAHTSMEDSTDEPFTEGAHTNDLLRPYDWGLAYDVASRLLVRDPTPENVPKSVNYANIAKGVLADVIQVFKALEKEEPMRIRGGRYFNSGNPQTR